MVWNRDEDPEVLDVDEEDPFLTELLVKMDNLTGVLGQYVEKQPAQIEAVINKLDTLIGLLNCYLSDHLAKYEPQTFSADNPFKPHGGGSAPTAPNLLILFGVILIMHFNQFS